MNLTEALNQKLEILQRDFNNIHSDLQVSHSSIKHSRNEEEKQQILAFIDTLNTMLEKKRQDIAEVKAQIEVVKTAEQDIFQKDYTNTYSEEESRLLRQAFDTPSPFYQKNNTQGDDLDEPMTR